ncbi:MAG: hypothetical protein LBH32_00460 [Dysgonamonadaceae bacterium]|jgi:hypothetical protein|nr:hypothetical protein [Dysgonamonadaceae bacterium]
MKLNSNFIKEPMLIHLAIRNFINYILLNAYSANSAGFYNGKSGIALCLFEIARVFDDETLEDKAFELLQEALVLSDKNKIIDFENGLSGVGFVLLYLIENRFLDADFKELFGEQENFIRSEISKTIDFSEKDLPLVYFAVLVSRFQNSLEYSFMKGNILNKVGELLEKKLDEFDSPHSNVIKSDVLNNFEFYLKVCLRCKDYTVPVSLVEKYMQLFRQGKIAAGFATGYYLEQTTLNLQQPDITAVAQTIMENAAQNIYPHLLTLSQRIDLLYLSSRDDQRYQKQISPLEKDLFDTDDAQYEKKIIQSIPFRRLIAGYGFGLARLLLYWVYMENKRNRRDCSRFNYLF